MHEQLCYSVEFINDLMFVRCTRFLETEKWLQFYNEESMVYMVDKDRVLSIILSDRETLEPLYLIPNEEE